MKFVYEKTEFKYFEYLLTNALRQTGSLVLIIVLILFADNYDKLDTLNVSLSKNVLTIILIGLGIILIDVIEANRTVQNDKKKTGGMYGKYVVYINKDNITLEYEDNKKIIEYKEIKKILFSKRSIIINFGDKDINIFMCKEFFKIKTDFKLVKKALEKEFTRNVSKNIKKRLFE